MTPATLTHDSSRDIVAGFLGDMIARLGWHAAQAWWAEGDELVPGMWALTPDAPASLRELVTSHEPLLIEDAGLRFLEPTPVAAAALPCVRSCVAQLESLGLSELVVLDIPGVFDLDVRLVFVPSRERPFTPRIADVLASAARLMPTVIRGERERSQLTADAGLDALTGLLNRRGLERAVAELPAVVDHRAVLFIDLDKFKAVNDTHGHPVGDDVLTTVARHLSSQIRPSDCLARLGGDEFVIVASAVAGADAARHLADRILAAVTTELRSASGSLVPITASVGVALWDGVQSFPDALAAADHLMYDAKHAGGGVASVDDHGRLVLSIRDGAPRDGTSRLCPPLVVEPLSDLVSGEPWGRIIALPGALASLPTDSITTRVVEAVGDQSTGEVIIELSGASWSRPGQLAQLVAAVQQQRPLVRLSLMIGEGVANGPLRDELAAITSQYGTGIVLVAGGADAANVAVVGTPAPRAIALTREVTAAMADDEPPAVLVRIVVAVAGVLEVPVIARTVSSARVADRLIEAGCRLAHFTKENP